MSGKEKKKPGEGKIVPRLICSEPGCVAEDPLTDAALRAGWSPSRRGGVFDWKCPLHSDGFFIGKRVSTQWKTYRANRR